MGGATCIGASEIQRYGADGKLMSLDRYADVYVNPFATKGKSMIVETDKDKGNRITYFQDGKFLKEFKNEGDLFD